MVAATDSSSSREVDKERSIYNKGKGPCLLSYLPEREVCAQW